MGSFQVVFPPHVPGATARGYNGRKGGGYTAVVQSIYEVPPPAPTEEHNKAIESLHTIAQGMQDQLHEMGRLAQPNAIVTLINMVVMSQLAQLVESMD